MTSDRAQRFRSQAGYSIIELLTNVAILAILVGAAIPHLDSRRQDLQSVTKMVLSDYRFARVRSITSGVHFNVTWTATNAYQIYRMKLVGTTWSNDGTPVKQVTLPSTVIRNGTIGNLEFNTRGMMITGTSSVDLNLTDSKFGGNRKITIWPSGQSYVSG